MILGSLKGKEGKRNRGRTKAKQMCIYQWFATVVD